MPYESFWVVAGTAAPVLGLAHAVAFSPLLTSKAFGGFEITIGYIFAIAGATLSLGALAESLNVLGNLEVVPTSRLVEVCLLLVSFVLVVGVSLMAGLADEDHPAE